MFLFTHHENTELSYDKQVIFFWLKKRHFEEFCIGCIQVLTHQKKNTYFWLTYRAIGNYRFHKNKTKKPAKFSFYIKTVAHCDLSPKRDKSCYLFWCTSIVISLSKFLRFFKSKYAIFFHYFSKQCFS